MNFYKRDIPIIDIATPAGRDAFYLHRHPDTGDRVGFGFVPRDLTATSPKEMFDPPQQMPAMSQADLDAVWEEQERQKSSLEHLYLQGGDSPLFINLDQDGDGYCWSYSTGTAIMLQRAKQMQPSVRINPHATAAIIKGGRNEGGWCGLSAKFARETGYALEGTGPGQWPLQSRDLRYDTPQLRAEMAKNKTLEEWIDLSQAVYEVSMAKQYYDTALACNQPCPSDFQELSHSMCVLRRVKTESGQWDYLCLNSWKGWGRHGLGVFRGLFPVSMLSIRQVTAS